MRHVSSGISAVASYSFRSREPLRGAVRYLLAQDRKDVDTDGYKKKLTGYIDPAILGFHGFQA